MKSLILFRYSGTTTFFGEERISGKLRALGIGARKIYTLDKRLKIGIYTYMILEYLSCAKVTFSHFLHLQGMRLCER